MGQQVFTTTGDHTFTVPDATSSATGSPGAQDIRAWGAPGNGGDGSVVPGGGGGGGSFGRGSNDGNNTGNVVNLHVGAHGENTWWRLSGHQLTPGTDGDSSGNGGTGGSGSGGLWDFVHSGGNGGLGDTLGTVGGGGGGAAGETGAGGSGADGSAGGAGGTNGGTSSGDGGAGGTSGNSGTSGQNYGGGGGGDGLLGATPGTAGISRIQVDWISGHLTVTQQPTTNVVGTTISTILTEIRFNNNSLESNAYQNVTVTANGFTFASGTTTLSPASGVLSASDLVGSAPATNCSITFTHPDCGSVTTSLFDIIAPFSAWGAIESQAPYRPTKAIYRPY